MSLNIWATEFEKRNGRKLKVLHVGNIANNAYLNSKILREAGFECDVLSYDYYHIMGCPEWEECKVDMSSLDQFNPHWYRLKLKHYERPKWFVQGRTLTALKYLIHRGKKNRVRSSFYWFLLSYQNRTNPVYPILKVLMPFRILQLFLARIVNKYFVPHFRKINPRSFLKQNDLARALYRRLLEWEILTLREAQEAPVVPQTTSGAAPNSNNDLLEKKKLSHQEQLQYHFYHRYWLKSFSFYDIIQFYATSGIYGMISGRQYLAFEHGTIRTIPFEDSHLGRLTEAVYQTAQGVFITNCDNIVAAKRLGLKNYRFVPHPINDDSLGSVKEALEVDSLRKKYGAEFIILHPSRQDWSEKRDVNSEKGNDIFVLGIAEFLKTKKIKLKCILIEWGVSVQKTKNLIQELGLEENFVWVKPLTHSMLVEYMDLSDAVFDQATIGTFGAIPPKCLSMGKPVFVYLEEKFHEWCFPKMPPVFGCKTPTMVAEGLRELTNPDFDLKGFKAVSQEWFFKNYSKDQIIETHVEAYIDLLKKENHLGAKI